MYTHSNSFCKEIDVYKYPSHKIQYSFLNESWNKSEDLSTDKGLCFYQLAGVLYETGTAYPL